MAVFIGFESALKYLLANGINRERAVYGRRFQELKPTRAQPQPGKTPSGSYIESLGFPDTLENETLTICVAKASDRPRSPHIQAHVWNGPKRGTYLAIDGEFYTATPEAVFVQLARKLSTPHLIELAFMLCGTYIPLSIPSAQHNNTLPLTNSIKLQRYVEKCSNIPGIARARIVLPWILDGSASVMETRLLMLLCLPPRFGGYGLPIPALNETISLSRQYGFRITPNTRKPDLYWKQQKVALEYDSKTYHAGEARVLGDRQRANEFESSNIKTLSAGPKDLYDTLALDNLATQVAKTLGHRLRFTQADYLERRLNLHKELIGAREWELLKLPRECERQF